MIRYCQSEHSVNLYCRWVDRNAYPKIRLELRALWDRNSQVISQFIMLTLDALRLTQAGTSNQSSYHNGACAMLRAQKRRVGVKVARAQGASIDALICASPGKGLKFGAGIAFEAIVLERLRQRMGFVQCRHAIYVLMEKLDSIAVSAPHRRSHLEGCEYVSQECRYEYI